MTVLKKAHSTLKGYNRIVKDYSSNSHRYTYIYLAWVINDNYIINDIDHFIELLKTVLFNGYTIKKEIIMPFENFDEAVLASEKLSLEIPEEAVNRPTMPAVKLPTMPETFL